VDLVCVIASNDAFVMSAWGKVNGIKDEIVSFPRPQTVFCHCLLVDVRHMAKVDVPRLTDLYSFSSRTQTVNSQSLSAGIWVSLPIVPRDTRW